MVEQRLPLCWKSLQNGTNTIVYRRVPAFQIRNSPEMSCCPSFYDSVLSWNSPEFQDKTLSRATFPGNMWLSANLVKVSSDCRSQNSPQMHCFPTLCDTLLSWNSPSSTIRHPRKASLLGNMWFWSMQVSSVPLGLYNIKRTGLGGRNSPLDIVLGARRPNGKGPGFRKNFMSRTVSIFHMFP